MADWIKVLLATTALTAIAMTSANAAVVQASTQPGGGFGTSSASPTLLDSSITQIIGDVDAYSPGYVSSSATANFFSLTGSNLSAFQLSFVASQVGGSGGGGSSAVGYSGLDSAANFANSSGTVSLPLFAGATTLLANTSPDLNPTIGTAGNSVSVSYSGLNGLPADLDPILTLYDAAWDPLDTITLTSGTDFTVAVSGVGLSALNFSVATPFDYTVDISTTAAPEPAGLGLLGVGMAALAARRRRKR